LRRRYSSAGAEHKRKLLDQAQELLGYHRKAAIRALRAPAIEIEAAPQSVERFTTNLWTGGLDTATDPELPLATLGQLARAAGQAATPGTERALVESKRIFM
jgi:hypothetical protein